MGSGEAPGEWNEDERDKCGAESGDDEHPEEQVVDADGQQTPVVEQSSSGVVAVIARHDAT